MTTATVPAGAIGAGVRGNTMAARWAITRWAWRLFRREWRQQLLVLALIVVAVAAAILGGAVSTNTPVPATAAFGTAQDLATFSGSDHRLATEIASLEHRFGPVEVIENQTLAIPGSQSTYELRAQSPTGPYGRPLLSLLSGRYPSGPGQVALTPSLASTLGALKVGDRWNEGGRSRVVVGLVQDPENLVADFALVAPGQVSEPTSVTVLFDAHDVPPASIGTNVQPRGTATSSNVLNPETITLAGLTLVMILIALVSVGGFTVLAQRRMRSLGMLSSLGATDANVGLVVRANGLVTGVVGAVVGVVLAIVMWLAYRPHLQSSVHHDIGTWALPWWVVAVAVVLAILAAFLAATRPARAVTRVPVVAALSGRPPSPRQIHRSAVPGVAFLVVSFLLLGYAGSQSPTGQGGSTRLLVLGLVALVPGVILLAPFCLSALARAGRRAPIAVRLALRDLARYRARSGSALAAISIGVLIAVIVAIVAAARYGNALDYAGPNMASNQLIVYSQPGPGYTPPGFGPSVTASQLNAMRGTEREIASTLGATAAVELEATPATLHYDGPGRDWYGSIYVATPQLLRAFRINSSQIARTADILTMRPGISGLSHLQLDYSGPADKGGPIGGPGGGPPSSGTSQPIGPGPGPGRGATTPACSAASECLPNPVIQEVGALPSGVSAPNTVITEAAVHRLGLPTQVTGWLIQAPQALTTSQINNARLAAASAGMTIESKNDEPTSAQVINTATGFGVGLALALLAMSVGLIRSETAGDLRTLTATGASTYTRRTLTAATAGALALLGAILGTGAGYVGVIGYLRSNSLNGGISALGNVPVANLLVILVGMPLAAVVIGWLLAGRQPAAMARQAIG